MGDDEAARLYGIVLGDTLRRVSDITGIRRLVAWSDAPSDTAAGMVPAGFASRVQRGDGLGARLAALCADLFAEGAAAVVLIGADSPALPRRFVVDAADRLRRGDVDIVVGPAADGGFYLLGATRGSWRAAREALTAVLDTMPSGDPRAFEHVRAGAAAAGLRTGVLPLWIDVDHADDLPVAVRMMPELGATKGAGIDAEAPRGADSIPSCSPPRLREVYLHLTDRCSGTCPHCYAADNPKRGDHDELSTTRWLAVADQAIALGATGFVMIGGDPFARSDLLDLIEGLAGLRQARVRLFFSRALDARQVHSLASAGHGRLTPLLSIDGTAAHERLRGPGTLAPALATAQTLVRAGLDPVVNTVLLRPVLPDLPELVDTLAAAGVRRLHLILPHRRGGLGRLPGFVPSGEELLAAVDAASAAAGGAGVVIDNHAAWRGRSKAPRDLCSAGCSLLAVDPYGRVSACPITCGDDAFVAGHLDTEDLETIYHRSPTLALLRHSHARDRLECRDCPVVDVCGGECWVQAHYAAVAEGRPAGYSAPFPYCGVVRPLLERLAAVGDCRGAETGRRQYPPARACAGAAGTALAAGAAGAAGAAKGPDAGLGGRPPDYTPFDCI